jgi:hypothetical protein
MLQSIGTGSGQYASFRATASRSGHHHFVFAPAAQAMQLYLCLLSLVFVLF